MKKKLFPKGECTERAHLLEKLERAIGNQE